MSATGRYGILAEFASPAEIVAAAQRLHLNGFRRVDAYTPYPIDELDQAMAAPAATWLPILIFCAAIAGAILGYAVQYWAEAISYPINVGGRPYNSWPAFAVSAIEVAMLCGLTAGFVGFLLHCRLPLLWHPIFAAEEFERASQDRFFLCVEARDPHFDTERLRRLFAQYGAVQIVEVAA